MVLWQPRGGHELPEAPSSGVLGGETGWYFTRYEDTYCFAPTVIIKPARERLLKIFQEAVACLGTDPVDILVQSTHDPSSTPTLYWRESIAQDPLQSVFGRFSDLLLKDPGTNVTVMRTQPDYTVELAAQKLIFIVGQLRGRIKQVCARHGIPHNPTLQLYRHIKPSIHSGMEYRDLFGLFISSLDAKEVRMRNEEEEEHPYTPF